MAYLANIQLDEVQLDALFNFETVCDTLGDSAFLDAQELMEAQGAFLKEFDMLDLYHLFLSNLNFSLHQYFLREYSMELHTLCFDNNKLLRTVFTYEHFKKTGSKILHSYFLSSYSLKKTHSCIATIVHYIRNHLDQDFNLDDLGTMVFLNKCYLCSMFKNVTGMSLSQFINQERVKQSEILLATTDMAITDISKTCGFRSTTYFSTVFKAATNLSPRDYRIQILDSINSIMAKQAESEKPNYADLPNNMGASEVGGLADYYHPSTYANPYPSPSYMEASHNASYNTSYSSTYSEMFSFPQHEEKARADTPQVSPLSLEEELDVYPVDESLPSPAEIMQARATRLSLERAIRKERQEAEEREKTRKRQSKKVPSLASPKSLAPTSSVNLPTASSSTSSETSKPVLRTPSLRMADAPVDPATTSFLVEQKTQQTTAKRRGRRAKKETLEDQLEDQGNAKTLEAKSSTEVKNEEGKKAKAKKEDKRRAPNTKQKALKSETISSKENPSELEIKVTEGSGLTEDLDRENKIKRKKGRKKKIEI